jgi:coenzyme F420 hydrogenase subunit beta
VDSIEATFLGRVRSADEAFGVHRRVLAAKSRLDEVLRVGQDGGFVTTLLWWALDKGVVDGAIVTGVGDEPWRAEPRLVTSKEEVLRCAGTKYAFSPNPLAIDEAIPRFTPGREMRVALVGTPCHIQAVRKAQFNRLVRVVGQVRLLVGLACSESFDYEPFFKGKIEGELGIPLSDVAKTDVKGRFILHLKSGETVSIPLKEAKKFARQPCTYCDDLTSELADLSAGCFGADGWTIVIVRSEEGEEVVNSLVDAGLIETRPIKEFGKAYELMVRLSKAKRVGAAKARAQLTPPIEPRQALRPPPAT